MGLHFETRFEPDPPQRMAVDPLNGKDFETDLGKPLPQLSVVECACGGAVSAMAGKEFPDRFIVHFVAKTVPMVSLAGTRTIEGKLEIVEQVASPVKNLHLGHVGQIAHRVHVWQVQRDEPEQFKRVVFDATMILAVDLERGERVQAGAGVGSPFSPARSRANKSGAARP